MKPLNSTTTPTAGSLTSIIPAKTYHGISDPGTGGVALELSWQSCFTNYGGGRGVRLGVRTLCHELS